MPAKKQGEKPDKFDENYFVSSQGHIRDRIIVNENPETPPFVALNGFAYDLPKNVEIDLPRPVRKMLDTLFYTKHNYVQEGPGVVKDYPQHIRRVTYTLIKEDVGRGEDIKPELTSNPFIESAQGG
jgi:hypothetical protein